MLEHPLLLLFPAAMIYAAVSDFFTMTIPNRVSLALIAGFLVAAIVGGLGWTEILRHLGVGFGMLILAIAMFSQGWLGGGDAKLLAASALWFGFDQVLDFVVTVALFGGLLSVSVLAFRNFVPSILVAGKAWAERLHDKKSGVPYGIALAAAGLWIYPSSEIFRSLAA